jgi:hypothetical protein
MIWYLRDPKNSTKKKSLLEIINFWQSINIQKSVAFLYSNNAQTEKEIRETIPFTIASKTIKYLRIRCLNKKPKMFLMKTISHWREKSKKTSEDGKDLPCSWIGRTNIVKMAILTKACFSLISLLVKE